MSWETLKAAVSAVITTNGANEITGEILRNLFNTNVIPELGGSLYLGIATPSTNPGSVEKPNWYFASEDGIYTHFSGVVLEGEVCILKYNGSTWIKDTIFLNSGLMSSFDPISVDVPFEPYEYDVPEGKVLNQIVITTDADQPIVIEFTAAAEDIYSGDLDSTEALVLVVNKAKKTGTMPIYFRDFTDPFNVKFYLR